MLSSVLFLRLWQASAGLLTTLLVVYFLTPELQGWYYSFLSVVALYTLFDLGLSTVLVQVSAHAAVGMRWGNNLSCSGEGAVIFNALLGKALRWYLLLSVVFILLVLPCGYLFFSRQGSDVSWRWPWGLLCLANAAGLIVMPFLAVLEGAGQIAAVYRVRLLQAILGSLACWAMLACGAELWAASMVALLAATTTFGWLLVRARSLLVTAWEQRGSVYDWRAEIWPLQWRMAVSWLCGYMLTQINIPILFHMQGAVLAGQFGLSLAVVNTLGLVCQSWFTRHVPLMAQAVVSRDWKRFDDVFFQDLVQSIAVFATGAFALLAGYQLFIRSPLVSRLLPFWPFAGLLVYAFVSLLVSAWATHLRSFRREPLLPLILFCTLLIVPGVLVATRLYSIYGMIAVLSMVYLLILLPLSWFIWRRCNRDWRLPCTKHC
jgi:hypothetical protein